MFKGVLLPSQVPGEFMLEEKMQLAPIGSVVILSDILGFIDLRYLFSF